MTSKSLVPAKQKKEDQTLTTQNDYLTKFNELFLVPQMSHSSNIFKSPLVFVADILRKEGYDALNMEAALLTYIIINSARLKIRFVLGIVCDELSIPRSMISLCLKMAPDGSYVEAPGLDKTQLHNFPETFDGHTLISTSPQGFKKVSGDLLEIIDRGYCVSRVELKSKHKSKLESEKIYLTISLIEVAQDPKQKVIGHPGMITVPMSDIQYTGNSLEENEKMLARIRKGFSRLTALKVEIPFIEMIKEKIVKQSPTHFSQKMNSLVNLISICTIINNPPLTTGSELMAKQLDVDHKKWLEWDTTGNASADKVENKTVALVASKVDYYFAWLLLNKRIPARDHCLTDRQERVFNTIKIFNMGKTSHLNEKKGDPAEWLINIIKTPDSGADREEIQKFVNKDGGTEVSRPTLNGEIQHLMDEELIERRQAEKSTKYDYYIITFDYGKYIELPHPSEIKNDIYEGKKISVLNPLTNIVDEI